MVSHWQMTKRNICFVGLLVFVLFCVNTRLILTCFCYKVKLDVSGWRVWWDEDHALRKEAFIFPLFILYANMLDYCLHAGSFPRDAVAHTSSSKVMLEASNHVRAGVWKHLSCRCPPLCSNCEILMMFIWCTNSWLGHLGSSRIFGQGVFVFKWRRTMWGKVRVCSVFWGLFNLVTQYHTICKIAFNMPGINNKYT